MTALDLGRSPKELHDIHIDEISSELRDKRTWVDGESVYY